MDQPLFNSLQVSPEDFFTIQISWEFYPQSDEAPPTNISDSPLDDIRQMIVE